ncbi:bifunctional lysylphosphatidylglycerol flippase/synthetase MprF [Arthrobacter sp. A5]|uniref:bifunctional lysylphosphatidylglycerol flippase/synthetase MprF n=1 Tax=Arthrobacter sp. A5 TaxID=576926 RepID=UPI003DA80271
MHPRLAAARRVWQWIGDMAADGIRHAPLTFALLVMMWAVALGTTSIVRGPHGHLADAVLANPSTTGSHPWSVVLSLLWAPDLSTYLWTTAALLGLGIFAERQLGTAHYAVAMVSGHLVGVLGGFAMAGVVAFAFPDWASVLATAGFGGPSLAVVGAAMASTASLDTMWRRRWRLSGFILLSTMVLFNGAMVTIMLLAAAVAGYLAGRLRYRTPHARAVPSASIRESRILIALICAAAAAGPPLAAVSANANGPFAVLGELFTGVQDTDPTAIRAICQTAATARECAVAQLQLRSGIGSVIMACVPSLLLLVFCYGLRLGRRFAWWGTLLLQLGLMGLAVVSFTSLRHGRDVGEATQAAGSAPFIADLVIPVLEPAAVVVLLLMTRRLFPLVAPAKQYRALAGKVALTAAGAAAVYLGGGLIVAGQFSPASDPGRLISDFPQRLAPVGVTLQLFPDFLPNGPAADVLYEWTGVLFWAVASAQLLASFRLRSDHGAQTGRERARVLLKANDGGAIGWMGLWPGNSYWFSADGTGYVPYRVLAGIALTTGDPISAAPERQRILREFSEHCAAMGWTPCLYSVTSAHRDAAAAQSWQSVQIAEETVLDLGALVFTGKKFQDIRTALNKAAREGVHTEWIRYPTAPLAIVDQIRSISEEWVADKKLPEMGFTLGGLEELNDDEVRCLLVIDGDRTVHAVASWLPAYINGAITGWTLDFMRRRSTGFKNSIEVLIAQAALDFQAEGYTTVSLSGAPLAKSVSASQDTDSGVVTGAGAGRDAADGVGGVGERPPPGSLERVLDWLGRTLEPVYGFRSLFAFKSKFHPRYVPLYMCYPDPAALPAIGQAIAKAYVPDASLGDVLHLVSQRTRR